MPAFLTLDGQCEAFNRSDQLKQCIITACGDLFCIGHGGSPFGWDSSGGGECCWYRLTLLLICSVRRGVDK